MNENNNIEVESLSLYEAFNELTKKRMWYENSSQTPQMARKDKFLFDKWMREKKEKKDLKNPIPEFRIREYLMAAGAECIQEEKWKLKEKE